MPRPDGAPPIPKQHRGPAHLSLRNRLETLSSRDTVRHGLAVFRLAPKPLLQFGALVSLPPTQLSRQHAKPRRKPCPLRAGLDLCGAPQNPLIRELVMRISSPLPPIE